MKADVQSPRTLPYKLRTAIPNYLATQPSSDLSSPAGPSFAGSRYLIAASCYSPRTSEGLYRIVP